MKNLYLHAKVKCTNHGMGETYEGFLVKIDESTDDNKIILLIQESNQDVFKLHKIVVDCPEDANAKVFREWVNVVDSEDFEWFVEIVEEQEKVYLVCRDHNVVVKAFKNRADAEKLRDSNRKYYLLTEDLV